MEITQKQTESAGAVSSTRLLGVQVCWGADPRWASLPISNVPEGAIKVRRRIRNKDVARAYVKTASELQEWILAPDGTFKECATIRLAYRQGINARTPNGPDQTPRP